MSLVIPGQTFLLTYRLENPSTWDRNRTKAQSLELQPAQQDPAVYIESFIFDPVAPATILGLSVPALGREAQVKAIVRMRAPRIVDDIIRTVQSELGAQGVGPVTFLSEADITSQADRENISPGAIFLEETFGPLIEGVEEVGDSIIEGVSGTFRILPLVLVGAVALVIFIKT